MSKNAMRDSEGFRKSLEVLKPHWQKINQQAEHDIREFNMFFQKDSSTFGRIIKCHLISEIYLDRYLRDKFSLPNLADVRLSYYQKVMLLPESNDAPALFKQGLVTLNKLRNKFAHNLEARLSKTELSTMTTPLIMSERPVSEMTAIEMVEKFTALSCSCLNPSPSEIEELFAEAMKHVVME